MKYYGCILILFIIALFHPGLGMCESSDEIFRAFGQQYEALKPPYRGSSVSSDYQIGQTALGTYYSTKMLGLLANQNEELLAQNNDMIQKYEKIIMQNEKIIQLLSIIAQKTKKE